TFAVHGPPDCATDHGGVPCCTLHVPDCVTAPITLEPAGSEPVTLKPVLAMVGFALSLTSRFCAESHCTAPTWFVASVAGVVVKTHPVCTGLRVGAAPTASGPLTIGSANVQEPSPLDMHGWPDAPALVAAISRRSCAPCQACHIALVVS